MSVETTQRLWGAAARAAGGALFLKVVGVGDPRQQVGVGQPVEVPVEALTKEEDRHQDGQKGAQKEEQQVQGGKGMGEEDHAGAPQKGKEPRAKQGGEKDELVVSNAFHEWTTAFQNGVEIRPDRRGLLWGHG